MVEHESPGVVAIVTAPVLPRDTGDFTLVKVTVAGAAVGGRVVAALAVVI